MGSEDDLNFKKIISETILGDAASASESLLTGFSQVLFRILKADTGALWLNYEAELYCVLVFSCSLEKIFHMRIRETDGLSGIVMKERRTMLVNDVLSDERSFFREILIEEGISSYLGAPLSVGGQLFGVLCFERKDNKSFIEKDVGLLNFSCKLLSLSLEHCSVQPGAQEQWLELFGDIAILIGENDGKSEKEGQNNLYSIWIDYTSLPKGISPLTLKRIKVLLQEKKGYMESSELAEKTGLSLSTIRRYLNYLYKQGFVNKKIVYNAVGPPSYRWRFRF